MFKQRVIYVITLLFLILGNLVFYSNKVFAYSTTPTHPNLTKEMIRLYNLYYDPDITGEAYNRIVQGSIDEDMIPRQAFHIYDPVYNRAPLGVITAKEWAIYTVQGDMIRKFANALFNLFGSNEFRYHGDFSWDKNIKNFVKDKTKEAWYGLGHILHLIADMTVPAHSRNDHHLGKDPFESWTGANLKDSDYGFADKIYKNNPYSPFDIIFISEAFDDLAYYSNKYFFSKDSLPGTNLGDQYDNPKIVKRKQEDYKRIGQITYAIGIDENGTPYRLAQFEPFKAAWYDVSPYAKDLNLKDYYFIIEDDEKLHLDYWKRLAPKAVEYGMAVIRLFVENSEYEKEKLAKQQNPLSMAQITNTNSLNSTNNNFNNVNLIGRLPEIQPLRLPETQSVIVEIVDLPTESPLESPKENQKNQSAPVNPPADDAGVTMEKEENEKKNYVDQNQPIIVDGPSTGNSGGVAPGSIKQEEPLPQENQNNNNNDQIVVESHLIINEIQIRDNEFVELYNPTSSSIDLSGYYFSYYAQNNDWDDPHRNQEFLASASIDANGYFLIGLKGYSEIDGNPKADWQPYDSNQLSNTHGSVAIFSFDPQNKTKTIAEIKSEAIDVVAWNNVNFVKEGTEFQQELGIDKSMQRKNFEDSNDNNMDFEHKIIPSPTNSQNQIARKGTSIPDNLVISEDTTWTIANSPYYITSNKNKRPIVKEGATLTIEPGVIIMPRSSYHTFLEIQGTLKAEGNTNNKIVFTSIKDGDYGGDGTAMPGDWLNMIFTSTSRNSTFKNVIFRYGGAKTGVNDIASEMIKVDQGSINAENIIIEKSLTRGLHLIDSDSSIDNSIFRDSKVGILVEGLLDTSTINNSLFDNNTEFGLQIINGAESTISNNNFLNNGSVGTDTIYSSQGAVVINNAFPSFAGNKASNNLLNGVLIHDISIFDRDYTLNANLPYILAANSKRRAIIAEGTVLIIEPGTIIKPLTEYYTPLEIRGTLKAEGGAENKIIFTSIKDDTIGGDTNNDDNATMPKIHDWKKIIFETTSTGSVLDYVSMYYGSGEPELIGSASAEFKTVDYAP